MRKTVYLNPHNMNSEGCAALAQALGILRISTENSRFRGSDKKIVINWGSRRDNPELSKCRVLNPADLVAIASNKKLFFEALAGVDSEDRVRTPQFTSDKEKVLEWLQKGHTACARQVLNGSGAEGLVLFDGTEKFVEAPLYTMYVKKQDEYRIHVVGNKIIGMQRKGIKKQTQAEYNATQHTGLDRDTGIYHGDGKKVDHRVRNLANGYVFVRQDVDPPEDVKVQALNVFKTLPLDFGAVDVIYNARQAKAFVLEVNTAPGLEGTTITEYANAFKEMFNGA